MLATLCNALSHPIRIQIIKILATRNSCVCGEVLDVASWSEKTILQHMRGLKNAGFISGKIDGSRRCYCLNRERWELFKSLIAAI